MSLAGGLLMVLAGLAICRSACFCSMRGSTRLYGLIGLEIGLLLGRWLTGSVGATAVVLGVGAAVLLGLASYALEPYRRILLGVSGGFLIGLSIAALFGLDGWLGGFFGLVLAAACGAIGGFIVPFFFDSFVVAASALAGAAIVMAGAQWLPNVGLFVTLAAACCRGCHLGSGCGRDGLATRQHRKVGATPATTAGRCRPIGKTIAPRATRIGRASTRHMSVRRIARVFAVLLVLVVLAVAAIGLAGIDVDAQRWREPIAATLSRALGREVRLEGPARLALSFHPALIVRDVRISQPAGLRCAGVRPHRRAQAGDGSPASASQPAECARAAGAGGLGAPRALERRARQLDLRAAGARCRGGTARGLSAWTGAASRSSRG